MCLLLLESFGKTELMIDVFGVLWLLWPLVCVGRIARRAGFQGDVGPRVTWFCLWILALWWFAFARWPSDLRDSTENDPSEKATDRPHSKAG